MDDVIGGTIYVGHVDERVIRPALILSRDGTVPQHFDVGDLITFVDGAGNPVVELRVVRRGGDESPLELEVLRSPADTRGA